MKKMSVIAMFVFLSTFSSLFARPLPPAQPFDAGLTQKDYTNYSLGISYVPSASRDTGLAGAADRLVATTCTAACGGIGWGWPITCPAPASVPANTLGPIGAGLLFGYLVTNDPDHLTTIYGAGDYASCYSYTNLEHRYGSGTPYFLWLLSEVIPTHPEYRQNAVTYYYQELANGTYGPSNYNTASYLQYIWNGRAGSYANMRLYDQCTLPWSAYVMGTSTQFDQYVNYAYDCTEALDNGKWYDVSGLACAAFTFALTHIDFDPHNGAWESLDGIYDMADMLCNYQQEDGGFVWSTGYYANWSHLTDHWYSNYGNMENAWIVKEFTVATTTDISFDVMYNAENTYDYGYIEYSTDSGATWVSLGSYTGAQYTWTTKTVALPELSTYLIRFRYNQDGGDTGNTGATINPGFYIDNIIIDGVTDTCDSANGWTIAHATVTNDDTNLQETAYAILALKAVDPVRYETQIDSAINWLWDMQFENGGFETYPGSGAENSQVTAEALWAIAYEPTPWNGGDVDGNYILTPNDALVAFRIFLRIITPNYQEAGAANCNGDASVTPGDAYCIWRHYLGYTCNCADPVIVPPTGAKAASLHSENDTVPNGLLNCKSTYNKKTQQTVLEINVQSFEKAISALGFKVRFPENMAFKSAQFASPVEQWDFHGAEPSEGQVIVGAFNVEESLNADTNHSLIKLIFAGDDPHAYRQLFIDDVVDDLAGFQIVMNPR